MAGIKTPRIPTAHDDAQRAMVAARKQAYREQCAEFSANSAKAERENVRDPFADNDYWAR